MKKQMTTLGEIKLIGITARTNVSSPSDTVEIKNGARYTGHHESETKRKDFNPKD